MLRYLLAALLVSISARAAQTVDGHIVNAATGADLPGVSVRLLNSGEADYRTTSDSLGRFKFESVNAGAYIADYHAKGFLPPVGLRDILRQTPFQVANAEKPIHLEVRLVPVPRISGRILDGTGKPVPNADLWVLGNARGCNTPSCFPRLTETKTDANGAYTIKDIEEPGAWILSASAPPSWQAPKPDGDQRFGWATTFYPGVTDPQIASKVLVQPGGELWNVDIKLAPVPVFRLRGKLLDMRGEFARKVAVSLKNAFGPGLQTVTGQDGTFEYTAVSAGDWILSAISEQGELKLRALQTLSVKDHDLEAVDLRLAPPFSVHGKVVILAPEGVSAPDPPNVIFGYVLPMAGVPIAEPDAQGNFSVENVYAGPYRILILEPPPAPYYLDSIRLGDTDAMVPDIPILSGAQPLTVIFKYGGGAARGTVENCGAGRAMLLPVDSALRRFELVREANCGPNGQFAINGIRPGEYYAFGNPADNGSARWFGILWDDAVLERQARKIAVRADETTTAELQLIKW